MEKIKKGIKDNPRLFQLFLIMAGSFILMSILLGSKFLSFPNIKSMATQFPEVGVLAIAVSLSMILGGINLSVVGIANLSGIFCALTVIRLTPIISTWPAILVGFVVAILVGTGCGALNGFLVTKVGIPAMLATLGSQMIFTGIGVAVTKGAAVFGTPEEFTYLSRELFGIPGPLIVFIVIVILSSIILSHKKFGFELYLVGTNPKVAKFSGINVDRVIFKAYVYGGILSAIAGLIIATRSNSAKASYGSSYILQCLLIAVLGGVDPAGGYGRISGIVMAVLSLQFLSSGFNMMRLDSYFKTFVWGAVLVGALILDQVLSRHREKQSIKRKMQGDHKGDLNEG